MSGITVCMVFCFERLKFVANWFRTGPNRDLTDPQSDFAGTDWPLFWWLFAQKALPVV
jgi:hypothetical protein